MRTRENASMGEFLTDFVKWVPRMDPEGAQKLATNPRFVSDGHPHRNTPKPTPHKRLARLAMGSWSGAKSRCTARKIESTIRSRCCAGLRTREKARHSDDCPRDSARMLIIRQNGRICPKINFRSRNSVHSENFVGRAPDVREVTADHVRRSPRRRGVLDWALCG